MTEIAQRNRTIKTILQSLYDKHCVSVTGGKGTAYGWVHAKIKLPKPFDCYCENYRKENRPGQCHYCRELTNNERQRATIAICEKNVSLGTYYADDGYNTPMDEMIIDVDLY